MNTVTIGTVLGAKAARTAGRIVSEFEPRKSGGWAAPELKAALQELTREFERSKPHSPRLSQLWIRSPGDHRAERFLFFGLALAALVGIGYGFSCLLDLVQNWALFERGVANLV
jgi:hypothetical protein